MSYVGLFLVEILNDVYTHVMPHGEREGVIDTGVNNTYDIQGHQQKRQ